MYTLSVILNLHREGLLASKTIRNLKNCLSYSLKSRDWQSIEFIAVLDNTDQVTRQVVLEEASLFNKIEEVSFGDLALSRNYGVNVASHSFTLFADGDDYVSQNAFSAIYNKFHAHYKSFAGPLEKLPLFHHIAVFPSLLVEFPSLFFQEYSDSNNHIINNMKFLHCYISRLSCPTVLLKTHLLRKNELPYGYEDWDLNNRLLSLGVRYKVAKNYVLYYRKHETPSLLQHQVKNKCIVRNSAIYSLFPIVTSLRKDASSPSSLKAYHYKPPSLLKKAWKVIKKKYYIKKHGVFLSKYSEERILADRVHMLNDMYIFSHYASFESLAYQKIMVFLSNKKNVILTSSLQLLDDRFLNKSEIRVILTSEKANEEEPEVGDYLNLYTLPYWQEINEDVKMNILTKAFVNSESLKLIHCVQWELGDRIIHYYSLVLQENQKKMYAS